MHLINVNGKVGQPLNLFKVIKCQEVASIYSRDRSKIIEKENV